MKKIVSFILISMGIFATPSYTGLTGGIDFPNAYILIDKNYTISGIVGKIDGDVQADFVIESNLLPQVEAGIKISTLQKEFDNSFLQSNFKFQIVGETEKNPAIAIGFTEFDEYDIQSDKDNEASLDNSTAYAFMVASKNFKFRTANLTGSGGLYFSKPVKETNVDGFVSLEMPVSEAIKVISEVYTFEKNDDKRVSANVGFDFLTNEKFRTQVFWRERNSSFGVSVNYIGILNNKK